MNNKSNKRYAKSKNTSVNNSPRFYKEKSKSKEKAESVPSKNFKVKLNTFPNSRNDYLYLYGKKKQELVKNITEVHKKNQMKKEMENCTFRPKINDYRIISKFVETNYEDHYQSRTKENVMERHVKWKNKKNEKIVKVKEKINEENVKECTFKPILISKTPQLKPLNMDENSWKFVRRLQSVKDKKEEKEKKLNPDYNLLYENVKKNQKNFSNDRQTIKNKKQKLDFTLINPKIKYEMHRILYDN